MSKVWEWPVGLLPETTSEEVKYFFEMEFREHQALVDKHNALLKENEGAKATIARQERYIAELEKQLQLLQKTLDLVDRNMRNFPDEEGTQILSE